MQKIRAPKHQQSLHALGGRAHLLIALQTQYGLWAHRCQEHRETAGT